ALGPVAGSLAAGRAVAAGAFPAGAAAAGVAGALVTAGVVVMSLGSVVVEVAGSPVVSVVPAAVSVPVGASTRVPDGSDLLKTEHAASSGMIASTNSTRIDPPLTQPAFTWCHGHVSCQNSNCQCRRNLEDETAWEVPGLHVKS